MKKTNTKKKKIFSIRRKLLVTILPLFLLTFALTAALTFMYTSRSLQNSAKTNLLKEAQSNAKTVAINLLVGTGSTSTEEAYKEISSLPVKLSTFTASVNDIRVMDEGNVFLVNINKMSILAHNNPELRGTLLSANEEDSFLGRVTNIIESGSQDVVSVRGDAGENYYVTVTYIEGTPWAMVSYVSQSYILSDLNNLLYMILIVCVVMVTVAFLVISITVGRMTKPINSLTNVLVTIAGGDFTVDIPVRGHDEITVMSQSLKDFVSIMREMISDIDDVSSRLTTSSNATRQLAGALYSGSQSQAQSMADVKTTIDQVASGVQDLAEHAGTLSTVVTQTNEQSGHAHENMQRTVDVASRGRSDMETVNAAMSSIDRAMNELKTTVQTVGKSTEEINSMVSLISDIADQTNLLSLNAAIEAARAGEAGKGFAVVAEEIRNLAEVSANSASQISHIIEEVNLEVTRMVEQTNQSVASIEENSGRIASASRIFEDIYNNVSETNDMLNDIVDQIAHVDDVATNIAALSQEQSASTEEILASTEVLAETSLQFSVDSRKVSENADGVSAASQTLTEHMQKFKV